MDRYITFQKDELKLARRPIDNNLNSQFKLDTTIIVRPGISGRRKTVSLESKSNPGYFLIFDEDEDFKCTFQKFYHGDTFLN